jgi:hypothetical protein
MKSRRWVITLIVIVCSLGTLIFFTWSQLRINERLKAFLNRRLIAAVGGSAHLEAVNLKWGNIYLLGLELPLSPSVHISIDSVRVVINPVRYITSGLDYRELVSNVHVYHPVICLEPFIEKETTSSPPKPPHPLKLSTICQLAKPWSDGFLFTWEHGNLLVINGNDTVNVVPEFRGILRGEGEAIAINGLGRCLADQDNISINGFLKVDSVLFQANLKMDHASLSEALPIPRNISHGLQPSNLSLSLFLLWDSTNVDIQGSGFVDSLSVPVDTFFIAFFPRFQFDVSKSNLHLHEGEIQLPGMTVGYSGGITSVLSPTVDLTLNIPKTRLDVITSLIPKFPVKGLEGNVDGSVQIHGPPDSLNFSANLSLPTLSWKEWNSQNVNLTCQGKPKLFTVTLSMGDILDSRLTSTSQVDLQGDSPILTSQVNLDGYFLRCWIPEAPALTLKGSGNWSNQIMKWRGELYQTDQPHAQWKISYQKSNIHAELSRSEGYSVSVELHDLSLRKPFQANLKCPNLLVHELLNRRFLPEAMDVTASVDGSVDNVNYDLELTNDHNPMVARTQGTFHRESPSNGTAEGKLQILGISTLPRLNGDYQILWNSDSLKIQNLTVENYLTGNGLIALSPIAVKNFELSINRLDLAELAQNVLFLRTRSVAGFINAEFLGQESNGTLTWNGNLHWFDGSVAGIQELWGTGTLEGTPSKVTIKECHIGQGIQLLAYADGNLDFATDSVSLSTVSRTKTVPLIISALTGKKVGWISGGAELDITMAGSMKHPVVNTYLGLSKGTLGGVPYDKIEAFSLNLFRDIENGNITIDSLKADFSPDFHIRGDGVIPIRSTGTFDCNFQGSGDLLAVLHELTSFFDVSTGGAKLRGHLGGTLSHPHFDWGELGIRDGKMVMKGLFGDAERIDLDLSIQSNGFVSVEKLEFQTHGATIRFRNYPEYSIASDSLEPIQLNIFGLNLGIWILDYFSGAVQVNLPGLMESPWTGNLELSGRVEGEKFLIAGPANRLLIRGSATVGNATVTYPFVGGTGRPSAFVQGVTKTLENAHWDLNLNLASDVHYYRVITTTEDVPIFGPITTVFNRVTADITADPKINALTIQHPDTSYIMEGTLESTQGKVEFLDLTFDVDKVTLEFDRFDPRPWVSARARTTVTDSTGIMRTIYLTFYSVDSLTGERSLRGRWGDFTLVLEDDQNHSQEEILGMLGYSINNVSGKVTSLSETLVSGYVDQFVFRPVEQALRKITGLDRVELNPQLLQNFFKSEIFKSKQSDTLSTNFGVKYLTGSQISVGKYITQDIFLGYTGELAGQIEGITGGRLGLIHLWNVEYRIKPLSPYLVLDLAYEYDDLDRRSDRSVQLRYSFGLP